MDLDQELCFDRHLKNVVRQASLRASILRRIAGFLVKCGILLLYKAQVKPYLEYGTLTWMCCSSTDLQKLDKVE